METVVKNIHLLRTLAPAEVIESIENRALEHHKVARISFKVLGCDDNNVRIETKQRKHPAENYLAQKDLFYKTRETFKELYDDKDLHIQMNIRRYTEPPVEVVTPEYVRAKMAEHKIKAKQLVDELGVTASTISAWINGGREMSNPVKAMFYLYFKLAEAELSYGGSKRGKEALN